MDEAIRFKLHAYDEMYFYEKRLQTFTDWPFLEDCKCTPEQASARAETWGSAPLYENGETTVVWKALGSIVRIVLIKANEMAKAGFVHCPSESEPDVACCFFCLKELEGWEPTDDPRAEHTKRSPNCGFLTLTKDVGELTVKEFFKLEQERLCICIRRVSNLKISQFRDEVERTRRELELFKTEPEPFTNVKN